MICDDVEGLSSYTSMLLRNELRHADDSCVTEILCAVPDLWFFFTMSLNARYATVNLDGELRNPFAPNVRH